MCFESVGSTRRSNQYNSIPDSMAGTIAAGVSTRLGANSRYFGKVLLRRYFRSESNPFLYICRQRIEPFQFAGEHLAVRYSPCKGDMADNVLETENIQCPDGWIQRIGNALLDCRRCFAPGYRRWIPLVAFWIFSFISSCLMGKLRDAPNT